MAFMFDSASSANPDTTGWNTSSVIDMTYMFKAATTLTRCEKLGRLQCHRYVVMFMHADAAQPDFSSWVPSALTNGTYMLKDIDDGTGSYSALLIRLPPTTARPMGRSMGNATYTTDGAEARAVLEANGWTITDGGQTISSPPIRANTPVVISRSQAPMANPSASPRATPPVPSRASTPRAPSAPVVSRSSVCSNLLGPLVCLATCSPDDGSNYPDTNETSCVNTNSVCQATGMLGDAATLGVCIPQTDSKPRRIVPVARLRWTTATAPSVYPAKRHWLQYRGRDR